MKKILTLLTLSSLAILTGCSSAELPTNTNETGESNTNAQVVVANTNSGSNTNEVVNENSNTNSDSETDEVDTSNWETYENDEYGFSFKYPEEWHLDDKTSIQIPGQYKLVLTAGESFNPNEGDFLLTITSEGEMSYKCAEWAQENICESVSKSIKIK